MPDNVRLSSETTSPSVKPSLSHAACHGSAVAAARLHGGRAEGSQTGGALVPVSRSIEITEIKVIGCHCLAAHFHLHLLRDASEASATILTFSAIFDGRLMSGKIGDLATKSQAACTSVKSRLLKPQRLYQCIMFLFIGIQARVKIIRLRCNKKG